MLILKTADALINQGNYIRKKRRSTGFVPTMGALHEGHLSLIKESRKHNECTVCSIFINPTQFNDPGDYQRYPVTVEKDIQLLEEAGTDILFLPTVDTIYPGGTGHLPYYELGGLEELLEGKFRPGHFQGVCQVMHRLLQLVQPDNLYMGQKDYQQCLVVARLLTLMQSSVRLHPCPILREPNGLAMSSRNQRLSPQQREMAAALFRVLAYIRDNIRDGDLETLKATALSLLDKNVFRLDYLEIAHTESLEPVKHWDGHSPLVVLIAAFLGEVRLIDNMTIGTQIKDIS